MRVPTAALGLGGRRADKQAIVEAEQPAGSDGEKRLSALGLAGKHEGGLGTFVNPQVAPGDDRVDEKPERGSVGGGVEREVSGDSRQRGLLASSAMGQSPTPALEINRRSALVNHETNCKLNDARVCRPREAPWGLETARSAT
jgi:hypothetical protein